MDSCWPSSRRVTPSCDVQFCVVPKTVHFRLVSVSARLPSVLRNEQVFPRSDRARLVYCRAKPQNLMFSFVLINSAQSPACSAPRLAAHASFRFNQSHGFRVRSYPIVGLEATLNHWLAIDENFLSYNHRQHISTIFSGLGLCWPGLAWLALCFQQIFALKIFSNNTPAQHTRSHDPTTRLWAPFQPALR